MIIAIKRPPIVKIKKTPLSQGERGCGEAKGEKKSGSAARLLVIGQGIPALCPVKDNKNTNNNNEV